jgi:hypothetical protein
MVPHGIYNSTLMVALFYSRNMPSLEYIDHKITDAITILPQNGIPSFKADAMQTKYPDWYDDFKVSYIFD